MRKNLTKNITIILLAILSIACIISGCSCSKNVSISFDKNSIALSVCQQETITANISGTSEQATWVSSDGDIATVDSNGVVTAKSLGTATITASVNGKSATCDVDVKCEYENLSLYYNSEKEWTIVIKDEEENVTVTPKDSELLVVEKQNQTGFEASFNIKCNKIGSTVLLINIGNTTIEESIDIKPKITLNSSNKKIKSNDSFTLEKGIDYTVEGCEENVNFSSSNKKVATIDDSGKITSNVEGKSTITLSLYGEIRTLTIYVGHSVYEKNISYQSILNDTIKDYTQLTNSKEEFEYLRDNPNTVAKGRNDITLDLESTFGSGLYLISIKLKDTNGSTFTQVCEKVSFDGTFVLADIYQKNLFPNREYYYDIYDADNENYSFDCGIIKTDDDIVRYINVDGVENFRDVGGWKTTDGNTVKYGLVYRGGRLNSNGALSESAKNILNNVLGLNTEIDLRTSGVDDLGQNENWFDSEKLYVKASIIQYDKCLSNSGYNKYVKQIFQTFANKNNYPIFFHCSWGADRTGTVAFLLNGLLGVSYEDLTRDFEITSFTQGKRWRSAANSTNTDWSSTGVMQDDNDNYVAWGKLYNYVMENYSGETLQDKIATYLMGIGITENEIQSIKDIMLEKPVTQINNPCATSTIKVNKNINFIATDVVTACIYGRYSY